MNLPPELGAAMLGRRVVFVRGRLDEAAINGVIAQLLVLAQMDAKRAIEVYVDSPGGAYEAALSLFDVIQTLGTPVSTTCLGTAGGASVLVLAGGAPRRRFALPHARIHLSHERLDIAAGQPTDVAGLAAEAGRTRERFQNALAQCCGHSAARIDKDMSASQWLSAAEARDYGLVDGIMPANLSGGNNQ
jgi:ATP-dependent Clp protease protease subunit